MMTTLLVEEGARVHADVVADEVIIAGDYSGKLICRQRLEGRSSGRVSGQVETFRLMLHEGASVDGELRMLPQPGGAGSQPPGVASLRGGVTEVGGRAGRPS